MYRLTVIGVKEYKYYFETLYEACEKMLDVLYNYNMLSFSMTGTFKATGMINRVSKLKKYIVRPNKALSFEIFKMTKEPLEPELVYYSIETILKKKYNL